MASATAPHDWRQEWHEFEDATYLNAAGQAPLPKASLRAAQAAIEWKKFPHRLPDSSYFDLPGSVRASLARLIGAQPGEIALTTGASTGAAAVAHGVDWKRGDEVLTGRGEFPLQVTTWKPLEAREGLLLKTVAPRDRFLSADDFIAAITDRTRLVSVSLSRFDDGARLDARRLADACHARGALLLLDASQSCGAIPFDVNEAGADFIICAGYKWLLGPFGTGFFWARRELIDKMRPGPFYWMAAVEDAHGFSALAGEDIRPLPGARRWDTAETASYFNLAPLDASLQLIQEIGVPVIEQHNNRLIEFLYERLPKDSCVPSSPLDARQRGPFGCFAARSPEKTAALYAKLREAKVVVSLREGNIRVSPHLYNTERDIDKLIAVVTA
jgi:selenocysteine lyase/cysteine desulfurase